LVRAFLDANVLFSAAYRPDAGLRKLWTLRKVDLVTSRYAAEEALRNLEDQEQVQRLDALLRTVEIVDATPAERPFAELLKLADKDRPILLAAIESRSTHLLTGDFKHFGPYYGQTIEGVLILPPSDFFHRFK
jgi:predicted nucleic acid-binding protein